MQVATPPTASEFRGGIIGVNLRPVSGADIVSLITDEHLLHRAAHVPQSYQHITATHYYNALLQRTTVAFSSFLSCHPYLAIGDVLVFSEKRA